jgi:acyl carrier protein
LPPVHEHHMSNIEKAVFDIITKTCSIPPDRITPASTMQGLGVNSLDAVQVLFEIEDRFEISVPQREDQYSHGTVGDLVEGVERLVAHKASATKMRAA